MSRIKRISHAITPEGHRANAIKQAVDLRDKVLSVVDDSNFSTSTARKITKKAAFSVVMRSLEKSKGLPLSLREHLAMKELNNYIALAKHNKSDFFYATNTDLLPISHPRSTREHSMTASALRISRSRWFAADPRITDERAKAVLASAFKSVPGSVEHLYYSSILLSLPQGIVPGDALIAATDGNSSESRSARARRQRRDSKGRFAYEGGGIRALIRRFNGEIFSISGRVVANAKNSRDVEVEFPDGKIAQVDPVKGEYIKAVLPTPDGYSPKPIIPSVSDEVINEKDLVFLDAPNGWVKDGTFKDFGDKVERYVDSNKEFVVFVSEKDNGTKDYQILKAKSAEEIDVVDTWAEVQDRLEGKEDQILNQKSELPKQKISPAKTKSGFEYNYPDNAYKIRPGSEYDIQGRVDEESPDFTDDPVELAQNQDERDLLAALEQAVSPGEDGENALGVGALPFGKGDEFVPAEAIFFALQEAGMDAPMELAKIYDKKLGNNANEKALNDFRKKEEVVSGNAPELAESFKKVTEQNPDLEVPTDAPKFDAKEAESAPLPALLEGLSEKELEQFVETKDHIPYLPKNEEIEMPEGYNPLSPEPFAAWKEVTAENPDAVLPEGFSDNPVYLAQEVSTDDLLKELRRSVEPGNEVPGAAVVAFPTEDGEDFVANVPGEAVRDALQLKGVDTNAELKKIADEGFVGQKEEPVGQARDDDGISNDFIKKLIEMHLRKEGVVVFPGDAFKGTPEEKEFYEEKLFGKDFDTVRKILSEEAEKRGVSWPTIEEIGEWPSRSSEVPAERQPGPSSAKDIYERRMAGDSLDKVAKELGIPREEVRRLEAEYARTLDKAPEEPKAELPSDAPAKEKPMNAYERLMAENKAEAEAVEERVAKLKKDAEDRVDEQGRSVPEGWGFIAKNKPNFGQVDRPDNYFNVYGNNNFEASVDADGKITVKDRNGLLPDKSYDNWEDLQADLENQKAEYSSAARERVREIAKKYGYSDEQIAAFDSMSQQELADFFANPENHTQAYADALDDLANSSAIDLPNATQKQRWAQMRKDEKILAQAGDAPSENEDKVGEEESLPAEAPAKDITKYKLAETGIDKVDIDGTSLQGNISATSNQLEAVFGKPDLYDEGKVKILWSIKFDGPDGEEVATIYDWENDNAPGDDEVYDWHIGGNTPLVVELVKNVFSPPEASKPVEPIVDTENRDLIFGGDISLEDQIKNAIEKGIRIGFFYNGSQRLVTPVSIYTNAKNGNVNVRVLDENGDNKTFTISNMEDGKNKKELSEEDKRVLDTNEWVQENAGRLAPIFPQNIKEEDYLWNRFHKRYEKVISKGVYTSDPSTPRFKFEVFNPKNNQVESRYYEPNTEIRNVRRIGLGEVPEDFVVPANPSSDGKGPKRGLAKRKSLDEPVFAREGRKMGGSIKKREKQSKYEDRNGVSLVPGDVVRYYDSSKDAVWGRGVIKSRIGAQTTEAGKVGGQPRAQKVYLGNLFVQWENEDKAWVLNQGGRGLTSSNVILQEGDNSDIKLPNFRGGRATPNNRSNSSTTPTLDKTVESSVEKSKETVTIASLENISTEQYSEILLEASEKINPATEKIANSIIEALERGTAPWRKPWTGGGFLPTSVSTGKTYEGSNILVLWAAQEKNNWTDNRWLTFVQAEKLGGNIKRGEKGTQIIHWKPSFKEVEKTDGTKEEVFLYLPPKVITVFNAEQAENINLPVLVKAEPVAVTDAETKILDSYKDRPEIKNVPQDRAYYDDNSDVIKLPQREQFKNPKDYLETLIHELAHSTGNKKRLNRSNLLDNYANHSESRGEEELIAEIAVSIAAARLGVEIDFDNVASYAQSWLNVLKNDKTMIVKAAKQAQKAVDYMLGKQEEPAKVDEGGGAASLEAGSEEQAAMYDSAYAKKGFKPSDNPPNRKDGTRPILYSTSTGEYVETEYGLPENSESDSGITVDEYRALSSYQGSGHSAINSYLRKDGEISEELSGATTSKDQLGIKVSILDSLISKMPEVKSETPLYRIFAESEVSNLSVGKVYTDKGFISASFVDITDPKNSKTLEELEFTPKSNNVETVIGMIVPNGNYSGVSVNSLIKPGQFYGSEKEFLMPRDTALRYLGSSKTSDGKTVMNFERTDGSPNPVGEGIGSKGKTGDQIVEDVVPEPQLETQPEPNVGEQGKTGEEISSDNSSVKKAGNNLNHFKIIRLQKGVRDSQIRKIYSAETIYSALNTPDYPLPSGPDIKDFKDYQNYVKAYKVYEIEFKEYKKRGPVVLLSDTAKKHLDGTAEGLQKYINEITESDWFQEKFGDGGPIGVPKASVRATGAAGMHSIGTDYLNGGSNRIVMNQLHSRDEASILHEIAHYATAIVQTSSYAGHGVEFARNHLYVLTNVLGSEYADGLKKQYRKSGAKF